MKPKLLMCFNSSEYGGVEIQILDIIRELSNELDIVLATKNGSLTELYKKAGAYKVLELYPTGEFDIKYLKGLYTLIRQEKIAIIHAHELKTGFLAMLVGFALRVPNRIYHVHTPFIFWKHNGLKKYISFIPNWTANFIAGNIFATKVIALTEYIKKVRVEKELISTKKIHIIPNAVTIPKLDNPALKQDVCKKYNITESDFIIGYVARFSAEKGHGILVNSFATICKEHINAKLLLISDGALINEIKSLVKDLGISDRVIFTGRIDEISKFALMSRFDLFAFPTLAEGFGITLLEAVSLKIPCLVSDLPVLHDVGKMAVEYFNVGDERDLASKLARLISDKALRTSMANEGYNLSRQYSMEKFIENYRELYIN